MDHPNHVFLSDADFLESSSLSVQIQDLPTVNIIHPCVPECEMDGQMKIEIFTDEQEDEKRSSIHDNKCIAIPMNGVGHGGGTDYLTAPPTITNVWQDKLSTIPSISQKNNYASFDLEKNIFISEKFRSLITALRERAHIIKQRLTRPTSPSSESNDTHSDSEITTPLADYLRRLSTVTFDSSTKIEERKYDDVTDCCCHLKSRFSPEVISDCFKQRGCLEFFNPMNAVDPQSKFYIIWMFFVSLCYLYNAWSIFLRAAFDKQPTSKNAFLWFTLDSIADVVYLLDLLLLQPRLKVISDGFWISEIKRTCQIYILSWNFFFDAVSLLPLDLLSNWLGNSVLLRLPRLLKIHTFLKFFDRVDHIASSPYFMRVVHTVLYMLFLIHVNACAYYAFSDYEGIGRPDNRWVYNGEGNAYIRCFLFATKIATSIGKNPSPQNEGEYLFMTVSWLSGVFIFAMLIGQVQDILYVASQRRGEYRKVVDRTMVYMKRLNLSKELRERTRLWFHFNWDQQKSLDEGRILKKLPLKMQLDIAMHVHYHVLSKVQLFQDFDRTLLKDIVLRLKPYLFLPGGYICRKGEVGTEMYIVSDGLVDVMGGENNDVVMAVLNKGSVFGEISLLSTGIGNRRTADVRSRGYSNLFVLSKADLHDAIKDFPMAQETLRKRSHKLFFVATRQRGDADDDRLSTCSSISLPSPSLSPKGPSTPKLLRTVLQVVSPYSMTANLIRRGSRSWHGFDPNSLQSDRTPFLGDCSFESSAPYLSNDNSDYEYTSNGINSNVFDFDDSCDVGEPTCFRMTPVVTEDNSSSVSEVATVEFTEIDRQEDGRHSGMNSTNHILCPVTVHRPETPTC